MEEAIETRNEGGLTREEYAEKSSNIYGKSFRQSFGGLALTVLGMLGGGALWISSLPNKSIDYDNYSNASVTLSTMQDLQRGDFIEAFNMPYMTDELRESLGSLLDYTPEKIQKLDEGIEIVESDIARMEQERPELIAYDSPPGLDVLYNGMGKIMLGSIPGFALMLSAIPLTRIRKRNLGTYIWKEEDSVEDERAQNPD